MISRTVRGPRWATSPAASSAFGCLEMMVPEHRHLQVPLTYQCHTYHGSWYVSVETAQVAIGVRCEGLFSKITQGLRLRLCQPRNPCTCSNVDNVHQPPTTPKRVGNSNPQPSRSATHLQSRRSEGVQARPGNLVRNANNSYPEG